MNTRTVKFITLTIVLIFIATVVIYPLAFNPVDETGGSEPHLEGE